MKRNILYTAITFLLILAGCAGTLNFEVVENSGGYEGSFDLVLDTPLPPPTAPPTPTLPPPTPTTVPPTPTVPPTVPPPTPTREFFLPFSVGGLMNYRTYPQIADNLLGQLVAGDTGNAMQWYAGGTFDWVYVEGDFPCNNRGWVAVTSRLSIGNYKSLPQTYNPVAENTCKTEGGESLSFGFNYNASQIRDVDYALGIASQSCASGHLVMNGIWFADRLYDAMVGAGCPEPVIVIREYRGCEGDCYAVQTPGRVIQDLCTIASYSNHPEKYYWEAINEPPVNDALLQWSIDVSNEARNSPCGMDFKMAVPAWGVGRVPMYNVDTPLLNELGRTLDRNGDALSVHNYFVGLPASGWGLLTGDQLLTPIITGETQFLRDNYCPTGLNWNIDGNPQSWWHMGREWYLIEHWQQSGFNIPTVITEFGADTMQDVKGRDRQGQIRPVNDILRDAFGHDFRGITTYTEYYRLIFPGWSFQRAIYEVLKCATEQYPVHSNTTNGYLMVAGFTWSSARDWTQAGFGLDGLSEFHQLILDS